MVAREQFHVALEGVKQEIIELAKITERALCESVDALYNQDIGLANNIIENDKLIDEREMDINNKAILLIAKQQPVAADLRQLVIALRITTDLERMGDNAKNIAVSTIELANNPDLVIHSDIKKMRDIAVEMVRTAVNAIEYEDISIARKLAEMDDKMDKVYKGMIQEMIQEISREPEYIIQIAFCARYMERFADHITNIGESIVYLVKGKLDSLN